MNRAWYDGTRSAALYRVAVCVLVGFMTTGVPARAQKPNLKSEDKLAEIFDDYGELRTRGEYRAALVALEQRIAASTNYVRPSRLRHRAELRFLTGDVAGAIETMTTMTDKYPEPSHYLELALMYRYIGQRELYEHNLTASARAAARRYGWDYSRREANLVAVGRIAELLGENPKTILNAHFGVYIDRHAKNAKYRIGAGDLAYRHAGYDVAAEHYIKALDVDPLSQNGLAGLAECFWKSSDPRLGETMQRLLDINPHHPRAKAIEVERLLDSGDGRSALKVIEEALEINPMSLRFRSLKAAAYFLEDDIAAMEAVQEEVLEFNALCSEVFRTAGRIASRHYRFREGAALQKHALEIDPDDHVARALYTLDLLRLGDEEVGRAELELAFKADPYNVHMFNLLELMDTLDTFESIERGDFLLRLPKHEAPLVASDTLDLLDEAIARYEKKYAVTLEKPVLIEMFDNHDDFMVRSVGLAGSAGHLGICFGKLVTLDSPSARPRGSWNFRSVLWHEFVHVITLQKTKNRMPRWLSEGISVHEEGQYSTAWSSKLDPQHRPIVEEEGVPGVRDLDAFFTQAKSGGHMMFGYFAAGVFVDFYADAYGQDAMNRALDFIAEGKDVNDALSDGAEVTFRTMDKAFQAYFEKRIKPFDNLPATAHMAKDPGPIARLVDLFKGDGDKDASLAPPSSPFTDALTRAAEAMEEEKWEAAEAALKEAHTLFPDHAGPDAPLRKLAALYDRLDMRDEYRQTLEAIVAWAPAELEASKKLLTIYKNEEDWEGVVRLSDWAVGIDPYDTALQSDLVEGLIAQSENERALDVLGVLTHLDSAHAMDHRLARAQLFAKVGQFKPARHEVVRVLEKAPHYWEAQELLLQLVEEAEETPEDKAVGASR